MLLKKMCLYIYHCFLQYTYIFLQNQNCTLFWKHPFTSCFISKNSISIFMGLLKRKIACIYVFQCTVYLILYYFCYCSPYFFSRVIVVTICLIHFTQGQIFVANIILLENTFSPNLYIYDVSIPLFFCSFIYYIFLPWCVIKLIIGFKILKL